MWHSKCACEGKGMLEQITTEKAHACSLACLHWSPQFGQTTSSVSGPLWPSAALSHCFQAGLNEQVNVVCSVLGRMYPAALVRHANSICSVESWRRGAPPPLWHSAGSPGLPGQMPAVQEAQLFPLDAQVPSMAALLRTRMKAAMAGREHGTSADCPSCHSSFLTADACLSHCWEEQTLSFEAIWLERRGPGPASTHQQRGACEISWFREGGPATFHLGPRLDTWEWLIAHAKAQ